MSESNKIYSKNFGNKREVYDGLAFQTRGGLTKDSLFLDENSVLRSRKQVDSMKANKKIKDYPVAVAVAQQKEVPETDNDDSGDDYVKTKAIDINKFCVSDLKSIITQMSLKMNQPAPKMSKLKKAELIDIAIGLSC